MTIPEQMDRIETACGDWQLDITRNMSWWHQWLSSLGHFHHTKDFGVPVPCQQLAVTFNGTQTSVFSLVGNVSQYAAAVLKTVTTGHGIEQMKTRYHRFADGLLVSVGNLQRTMTVDTWDDFIVQYTRFCAGLFLTSTIGRAGMNELMESLRAAGLRSDDIPELIATITYPEEHTPLFRSQTDLLAVGVRIQQGCSEDEREQLLHRWLVDHAFIPVNFCEEPWTLSDAEEQLAGLLHSDCHSELQKFDREHQGRLKEKAERLKHVGSQRVHLLSRALAEGTSLNEFRKNIFSRVSLAYREVFAQIARLGNSSNWRDCFFLLPDEMRSLLVGERFEIVAKITVRKTVGHYTDDHGVNRFIEDRDLERVVNFIETVQGKRLRSDTDSKLMWGFAASQGTAVGTVKIVLTHNDFHKVNEGDILVTAMTSVDFIPVMKKAGAFVTNEGGITSHAAIVAREMNKPCVINTKIATQLLKDGDRVKVDGGRGTVEVIV